MTLNFKLSHLLRVADCLQIGQLYDFQLPMHFSWKKWPQLGSFASLAVPYSSFSCLPSVSSVRQITQIVP